MSADLLNDFVIKVTGITQEIPSNVVCVLETFEDIGGDGELGAFSELSSLNFCLSVDVLHPGVMVGSRCLGDVLLEDDNV